MPVFDPTSSFFAFIIYNVPVFDPDFFFSFIYN